MESLLKAIDPNQLTSDMDGGLQYDHSTWIELRCVSTSSVFTNNTACWPIWRGDGPRGDAIEWNQHENNETDKCYTMKGGLGQQFLGNG